MAATLTAHLDDKGDITGTIIGSSDPCTCGEMLGVWRFLTARHGHDFFRHACGNIVAVHQPS